MTLSYFYIILLLTVMMLLPRTGIGQDSLPKQEHRFEQQDLYDFLLQKKRIKKKPEKKGFLLVIPLIASNPTAGVIVGAGLTYAYTAKPQGTKTSSISSNATYSTRGLLNCNIKTNVFISKDRIVLNGDWRYLINTESTYGLGSRPLTDSAGQTLEYSQLRIHETASWQFFPNFFAGIGFQFDSRFDIKDHLAQAGDSLKSFHYQYSSQHGFHPDAYITSGIGLNILYDSRDNQVNAYQGYYANINYLLNVPWLGSAQSGSLLLTEYRSYHPFSNKRNDHLLAFWLYGHFQVTGHAPYLALPYNGNDQRQKTARGYPFGAFRGEKLLIAETEYRYPISRNSGILGGVVFINATTTSNQHASLGLGEDIRPGYGAGLRIMLEKRSRTRLEIDAALGGKKAGFYFGVQETF